MLKRIIFIGTLLLTVIVPYAQVNLQTGSALFSLSMFNWQDDKSHLKSIVELNYTSGNGLRVNDVASNVGQGWSLVAGGVITRMQVGEPDDQQAFDGTTGGDQDISRYPNGFLNATVPAINGCPNSLTRYPIYGGRNQLYTQHNTIVEDRQQDYFTFQFNGKSGIFVVDTADGGVGRQLGDTKLIIKFQKDPILPYSRGIRTIITSFTIQDVDGLIYKFAQQGVTQALHTDYCDADVTQPQTQPTFEGGNVYHQAGFDNNKIVRPYIIGSWYLSEIDDPLTGRKITFNYISRVVNSIAGADVSYNLEGDYSVISHKTSVSTTPEISSIVYPDGHGVTVNYGAARVDLNGEYAVSSVDITYQGRFVSEYQLKTSYFMLNRYGTPVTPYQKSVARLCLQSVRKIGVDLKEDTPPYLFDYFLGSDNTDDFVPPPFFYAKDIWGFYNGSNSVAYDGSPIPLNATISQLNNNQLKGLCFLNQQVSGVYLNAKPKYARNGLLKQIVYPTGGTLSYDYDQNTGVLNGNATTVGGVHVVQTSSTDGGYSNGCSNPIVTQYNYVLNGAGSASSLWGLESPVNRMIANSHYAPEWKTYHWTWSSAPLGECHWHFIYPGILSQLEAIGLTDFQKVMEAIAPVLGVISIITDIIDVANLMAASGFFTWAAVIVDIIVGLVTLGISCFSDNSKDKTSTTYYSFDLNGSSPLPVQFKRVEVVENPGTIGKTVHEFTSSDDYAVWVPAGANPDFVAQQRFAPWAYGLPKLITTYDVNGNKVKQTENDYDFTYAQELLDGNLKYNPNQSGLNTPLVSCKCMVTHTYSQRNTDWGDPNQYSQPYLLGSTGDLKVDFYAMYTGRVQLSRSFERTFKTTDATQYVQKETGYEYNPSNYEVSRVAESQSNGELDMKNIVYSIDYSNSQNEALLRLVQNNIVDMPVSTYHTIYNPSLSLYSRFTGEEVTEFTLLSNGDIKPVRILEQRLAQPSFTFTTYSPDNNNNPSIYKVIKTFQYDANGNEVGSRDEGGRCITNIYDYNEKYTVATIFNADPMLDKPAYTSFETSALGNWTVSGTISTSNSVPAVTGTTVFTLLAQGANNISVNYLNVSRPYTLSFWASNGNVSVSSGATLTKSAPVINGYTYYEYSIAQGTSNVTLVNNTTAGVNIDELRLYPTMARMRTATFDPLIGKTSECDENNGIVYYEYDNLGRLHLIRDKDRNVIKMYENNSVSPAKQNGCPGAYSNHLMTELFTKSCPAGYVGTDVPYTIPAGRYTSSISQEESDLQAEVDLLTNGPGVANAGGSCRLIYYSQALVSHDTTETCSEGQKGGGVIYTVPAGRYTSLISQDDANRKAREDTAANAQAYANAPDHAICMINTDPDWNWEEGDPTTCLNFNGSPYTFLLATDINPNSSTYGQTAWKPLAPSATACPAPAVYIRLSYENISYLADGTILADVVARFYSDAGGTMAMPASTTVNYAVTDNCNASNEGPGSASSPGSNYVVLVTNATINYASSCPMEKECPFCFVDYYLTVSNDYTIIY